MPTKPSKPKKTNVTVAAPCGDVALSGCGYEVTRDTVVEAGAAPRASAFIRLKEK
jgi:hypothetical protein